MDTNDLMEEINLNTDSHDGMLEVDLSPGNEEPAQIDDGIVIRDLQEQLLLVQQESISAVRRNRELELLLASKDVELSQTKQELEKSLNRLAENKNLIQSAETFLKNDMPPELRMHANALIAELNRKFSENEADLEALENSNICSSPPTLPSPPVTPPPPLSSNTSSEKEEILETQILELQAKIGELTRQQLLADEQHQEWVAVLQAGHEHFVANLRRQMADDLDAAMQDAAAATDARVATAVVNALAAENDRRAKLDAESQAMEQLESSFDTEILSEVIEPPNPPPPRAVSSPPSSSITTSDSASTAKIRSDKEIESELKSEIKTKEPTCQPAATNKPAKKPPLLILALKCAVLEFLRYEDPRNKPDKTSYAIRNQSLKTISSLLHFDAEEEGVANAVAGTKRPPMFDLPTFGTLIPKETHEPPPSAAAATSTQNKPFFFNVFAIPQSNAEPLPPKTEETTTSSDAVDAIDPVSQNSQLSIPQVQKGTADTGTEKATRDSVLARMKQLKVAKPSPPPLTEHEHVVLEMVGAEERYVASLRQLFDIVTALSEPPTLLLFGDQKSLSSNITQLLGLHERVLTDLHARREADLANQVAGWEPSKMTTLPYRFEGEMIEGGNQVTVYHVADIYLHYMPFFMMYHPYIDNFDRASAVIDRLMKGNKKQAFLDRLRKVMDNKEADVSTCLSLLIKPVQAVPRYRLLLERLKKLFHESLVVVTNGEGGDGSTPDGEHEKLATERAVRSILTVAAKLNDSLKLKDSQMRVADIQSVMTPHQSLVQPGRRLMREGPLVRVVGDGNFEQAHRFHVFLMNDTMIFSTDNLDHTFLFHRYVRVCGAESREDLELVVKTDDADLRLRALNESDKQLWLRDLINMASPLNSTAFNPQNVSNPTRGGSVSPVPSSSLDPTTPSSGLKPTPFLARSLARATKVSQERPVFKAKASMGDDEYAAAAAAAAAAMASQKANKKKASQSSFSLNPFSGASTSSSSVSSNLLSSFTSPNKLETADIPNNGGGVVGSGDHEPKVAPSVLETEPTHLPLAPPPLVSSFAATQETSPISSEPPPQPVAPKSSSMSWFGASVSTTPNISPLGVPLPPKVNTPAAPDSDGDFSEVNF